MKGQYSIEFRAPASTGGEPFVYRQVVAPELLGDARVFFGDVIEIYAERARKAMLQNVEIMGHVATPMFDLMTFTIRGVIRGNADG